jgi:flagellar hook assembly protein FlgD
MFRNGIVPRSFLIALLALPLFAAASFGPAGAIVSNLHVRPNAFSPNADGVRDSTVIVWDLSGSGAACLKLTIAGSGSGGTIVRTFDLGARPGGPDSIAWNGTDSLGAPVPDRLYGIILEERNATCDTVYSNGQVTVLLDVSVPPVPTYDHGDSTVTRAQFRLDGIAAEADTVALFRDGARVDTVTTLVSTGAAARYTFDVLLTEGDNRFSVQSWDRAENLSPQATDVTVFYLNAPDIGIVSAQPASFSPNGDGRVDSTRMSLTLDEPTTRLVVQARRGLTPAAGAIDVTMPVALLYDGPAPAGPQTYPWDGTDSTGTRTTDGDYVLVAQAESISTAGTPLPSVRKSYARVVLDTVAPPAPVVDPLPRTTSFRTQVELNVLMSGSDSLRISRDGAQLRVDEVDLQLVPTPTLHAVPLHPGTNVITLEAIDRAGNISPVAGPYSVTFEEPLGFHAPERFRKDDAFGVNVSSPATSVVVELFTLRGTPVRQLTATGSATHYELPWDLKDTAGNFVGDGPYVARLRVGFPNGTGSEMRAAIVVVK